MRKPVKIGPTDESKTIKVTIHLRRRLDHHPIPSFESYIGCPKRERLSNDDFAAKWGAHQDDIYAVRKFCVEQGLTVLSDHAARRHVCTEGTVEQYNQAFGVIIHDHEKQGICYHAPLHDAVLPDHLSDTIIHVGLGEHPKDRMTETNVPATTPGVNGAPGILPAAYAALMGWPATGAAGQTIAVLTFEGTPYSLSDVQATWNNWGVAQGTIINISVDGTPITTNTFNGEWNMDIDVAYGFAVGATIAVYWTGATTSTNESYSRILFPNAGDPICSVTTASGAYLDEASLYTQPSLAAAVHLIYEDAALQGITVCVPTGDWGSGADVGDGKDHCGSENDPYVLAVGGTVVGNISGNSFVEWLANIGVSNDALYQTGGGGGISLYVPVPSYQLSANLPVSTNSGKAGRGIPDVSSSYASQFPQIENGGLNLTAGGTSQSTPMMAGLIASINKAVGRSVGFINPTLYAHPTTLCRDLNPTNTSGGPQSNANGYWIDSNSVEHNTAVPGYPVTTGWDACTGLGVINGNALISYLTSNAESPTIVGTTLTGAGTLVSGAPVGTVIGIITVQMAAPGVFSGTYSLSSSASPFLAISSTGVLTNTFVFTAPGPYATGVIVTQTGAANSPFSDTNSFTVPTFSITSLTFSNPNPSYSSSPAVGATITGITVNCSNAVFTGTLALGAGAPAGFSISGNNLVTTTTLALGTYVVPIVATEAAASNSPFTQSITVAVAPAITGISLSTNSVTGGSPSGTVVGTISVQISAGSFTGTLALSGTNASSFQLSGNNLETQGVVATGSYNVNIVATQSGATGSPFTQAETITLGSQAGGGTFTGTLTLTGANASSFQIIGVPPNATLATLGSVPAGTYNLNIVATQSGATGSPFTQAEVLTGTASTLNYQVSYSTSASGPWTLFNTVSTVSDTITGLTANTNYFFQVTPVMSGGVLGTPDVIGPILTQTLTAVGTPNGTNFLTSSATVTSVTLQMAAPVGVSGAITYAGQYRRLCDFAWIPVTLGSSSSANVSFPVSGLVANTVYMFRMNANGSRFSPPAVGTTLPSSPTTVSPDGTLLVNPAVQSANYRIISSSLASWTLVETATPFQIAVNGTPDATTSNVIGMIYSGGKVYYQNKQQAWFSKTLPTDTWTAATDPRAGVPTQ